MRRLLVAGSALCCLPGLYVAFALPYDIAIKTTDFSADRTAQIAVIFYAVYAALAFAPAIMLFRARRLEISKFKMVAMASLELVVVLAALFGLAAFLGGV